MKKKIFIVLMSLFMFLFFVSCEKDGLKLEISEDQKTISLTVGENEKINVIATEGVELEWTSSNPEVVTVVDGQLSTLKAGQATITVKIKDKDISVDVSVTVTEKPVVSPTQVTIYGESEVVLEGTINFTATVAPVNASQSVVWSVDDETMASITQDGLFTALKEGKVKVIATAKDTDKKAEREVTITAKPIVISEVTVAGPTSVLEGKTIQLTAQVLPVGAPQDIFWSVDDASIAEIDQNGLLKGKKAGNVVVTAIAIGTSVKKEYSITIEGLTAEKVTITGTDTVEEGKTLTFTAKVLPAEYSQLITWTVSDSTIATINSYGVLTALKAGVVKVIATATGTQIKDEKEITVTAKPVPTSVEVTGAVTIEEGKTGKYTAKVLPEVVSQEVVWATSDESLATIDSKGNLTALKAGVVKVIATAKDTEIKFELEVTITAKPVPTSVEVTGEATIEEGKTGKYTAKVLPEIVSQEVVWTTSDGSLATIDAEGNLTALKAGVVKVIATAKNTEIKFELEVTITAKPILPASVEVTGEATIKEGKTGKYTAKVLPAGAPQEVVWTTSDGSLATIDAEGNLTALKAGVVKVIATAKDTEIKFELEVTITNEPISEVIANPEYSSLENGAKVTLNDKEYEIGKTAFDTLEKAIAAADSKAVVLLTGEFSEALTISKAVTIKGGTFTNVLTIASGVDGLTFDGVTLDGDARILGDTNGDIKNFTFTNCVIKTSKADGPIGTLYFPTVAGKKNYDFILTNNKIEKCAARVFRFQSICNLVVMNNDFQGIEGVTFEALRIGDGASTGMEGKIVIAKNIFNTSAQAAMTLNVYVDIDLYIVDNVFENIDKTAFDLRGFKSGTAKVHVTGNTFKNGTYVWGVVRIDLGGHTADSIEAFVNFNKFINCGSYFIDDRGVTNNEFVNADSNYFDIPLTTEQFTGAEFPSFTYETEEALDKEYTNIVYVSEDFATKPYAMINGFMLFNGYATITEALEKAPESSIIKLSAGTYEGFVIEKPIKIEGPNSRIDPTSGEERLSEAIITSSITIKANDVSLKGLAFTSKGRVTSKDSFSNFEFINNNVYDIILEGASTNPEALSFLNIHGIDATNLFENITVEHNKMVNLTSVDLTNGTSTGYLRPMFMSNIKNLSFNYNYLDNYERDLLITGSLGGADSGGVYGKLDFNYNVIKNCKYRVLHITAHHLEELNILWNDVDGAVNGVFTIYGYLNALPGESNFTANISFNKINNARNGIYIDPEKADLTNFKVLANYNSFTNKVEGTSYHFISYATITFGNADNNYYGQDTLPAALIKDEGFVANSFFKSMEELEAAILIIKDRKLTTPVLTLTDTTISWDAIVQEGVNVVYDLYVDDVLVKKAITETSFDLSALTVESGAHKFAIMAMSDNSNIAKNSDLSETIEIINNVAGAKAIKTGVLNYPITGLIIAKGFNYSFIKDDSGIIQLYQYTGSNIGDMVSITGKTGEYNNARQLSDVVLIEKISEGNAVELTYTDADLTKLGELESNINNAVDTPLNIKATIIKVGNYYNFVVGTETLQLYNPTDEQKAELAKYVGFETILSLVVYAKKTNGAWQFCLVSIAPIPEEKIQDNIAKALNDLQLEGKQLEEDLVLPLSYELFADYTIAWSSSDVALGSDGKIAPAATDTNVVLTAKIMKGETELKELTYNLVVKAKSTDIKFTFNFSDYTAGVQYAMNEEHKLNDTVIIYTSDCHFAQAGEIRMYSSSGHDAAIISNNLGKNIKSIKLNVGNKVDILIVYGSNDGSNWQEVSKHDITSAYADVISDFTGKTYTYFKLDVEGTQQVRIKSMEIVLDGAL